MTVKLVETSNFAAADGLAPEEIRRARGEARGARRRVAEILEERLGLPPAQFLSRLAATFHFPALSMQDLDGLPPRLR